MCNRGSISQTTNHCGQNNGIVDVIKILNNGYNNVGNMLKHYTKVTTKDIYYHVNGVNNKLLIAKTFVDYFLLLF